MSADDALSFFRAWTADPLRVGAIAPSGNALAKLMTREIDAGAGPVLELGPGTGVFTRAMLAKGVRQQDLTLVEHGANFARQLQQRFPEARVRQMDASNLSSAKLFVDRPVVGVVSGLPLLAMSPRKVMNLLSGAFGYLRPGGHYYQFTYGLACPVPRAMLERLGLKARRIGFVLLNAPPASVYRISRRLRRQLA